MPLYLWHQGAFSDLLREGQSIQSHLPVRSLPSKVDQLSQDFALFDNLDADLIRQTALKTTGVAGPSGVDAIGRSHFCTSSKASRNLCHSLASVARRLMIPSVLETSHLILIVSYFIIKLCIVLAQDLGFSLEMKSSQTFSISCFCGGGGGIKNKLM